MAYVYEMTYEDNLADLASRGLTLCFHGHTHVQLAYVQTANGVIRHQGPEPLATSAGRILISPGSVGQPRDGDPRAAFAIWDRSNGGHVTYHRVTYDMSTTVRDLNAAGLPSQLATRLESGR
jgi:diadenosine tetraphosphatase ApaH/serine/threonine PP2A family protein phosphatase